LGAVYDTLAIDSPVLARRWCMLGVCPAPFDAAAAASIWEESDPDALVDALGALLRYSLLAYDRATQRFRIHDLLADIAAQHRTPDDDYLAHRRHAEHFLSVALEAQRLYERGTTSLRDGLRLFDASWEQIQAAVVWLAATATLETDQTLLRFARAPSDLVLQRTLPEQQRYWNEAVLQAARRRNDAVAEGRALVGLGNSYAAYGDTQHAAELIAQGLAVATQAGDQLGCAMASNDLAATLLAEGRADDAMPHLETALRLYKALGDRRRQGQTLLNLGSAQEARGQQAAATRSYAHSLAILRETGDVRTQVFVLGNLGISYTEQGELDRARRILRHAHRLAQALGDTATDRQVGWHLGVVEARQGRIEQARALMMPYVAYLRMIGDHDAAAFESDVEKLTQPHERATGASQ
ncbi:MAG TPA: tetratricopeptide repeat protein, partial [Roseiflexaceae bacterium]|nr:tetratricopeptide repeat protein [Roseiflexaceae bacterium]